MRAHAIRVPALPGGAAVILDCQTEDLTIWVRDDLGAEEVTRLIAQAMATVCEDLKHQSSPTPVRL